MLNYAQSHSARLDAVVVEQAPIENGDALAQTASLVAAFGGAGVPVHRVDAGYPKHLDEGRTVFPTPTHDENKAWACRWIHTKSGCSKAP